MLVAAGVALVLVLTGGILAVRFVIRHGTTEAFDQKFGDQHLKSAVAHIELHRTRHGRYPDSLRDLTYLGEWDGIWVNAVRYVPGEDRQSYFVEVRRGWMGRPTLDMPDEFWRNTGYDETLRPARR